jgi:hypothetical protein
MSLGEDYFDDSAAKKPFFWATWQRDIERPYTFATGILRVRPTLGRRSTVLFELPE